MSNLYLIFSSHIALFWLIGICILVVWTIINFSHLRRIEEKFPPPTGNSRSDSHLSILRKRTTSNSGGVGAPPNRSKSNFNVHFRPKL